MVLLATLRPRRAISPYFPVVSVASALAVAFVAATLPTPLYAIYSRTFGFSEITLTLIYAVYVLGNLGALFVGGRSSDQIGRRTAVLAGMAAGFASTLVFVFAAGTAWLFVARPLSGFATGLVSGAATAWIVELQPRKSKAAGAAIACAANFIGLAIGPLLAGLLAQFAPWPLRLSWIVYLVVLGGVAVPTLLTAATVEAPVTRLKELSLRPRLGVPDNIPLQFLSPAATALPSLL
jgi:MFS family permease